MLTPSRDRFRESNMANDISDFLFPRAFAQDAGDGEDQGGDEGEGEGDDEDEDGDGDGAGDSDSDTGFGSDGTFTDGMYIDADGHVVMVSVFDLRNDPPPRDDNLSEGSGDLPDRDRGDSPRGQDGYEHQYDPRPLSLGGAGGDSQGLGSLSTFTDMAANVGVQAAHSGFVRQGYQNFVQGLDAGDALTRTIAKGLARSVDSPIGRALVEAGRPGLSPPSGTFGDFWFQSTMPELAPTSANVTNTAWYLNPGMLKGIGTVALGASAAYGVYQTANSPTPIRTGLEESLGLASSIAGGYAGGYAAAAVGAVFLPELLAAGLVIGASLYLGTQAGSWGRSLADSLADEFQQP